MINYVAQEHLTAKEKYIVLEHADDINWFIKTIQSVCETIDNHKKTYPIVPVTNALKFGILIDRIIPSVFMSKQFSSPVSEIFLFYIFCRASKLYDLDDYKFNNISCYWKSKDLTAFDFVNQIEEKYDKKHIEITINILRLILAKFLCNKKLLDIDSNNFLKIDLNKLLEIK